MTQGSLGGLSEPLPLRSLCLQGTVPKTVTHSLANHLPLARLLCKARQPQRPASQSNEFYFMLVGRADPQRSCLHPERPSRTWHPATCLSLLASPFFCFSRHTLCLCALLPIPVDLERESSDGAQVPSLITGKQTHSQGKATHYNTFLSFGSHCLSICCVRLCKTLEGR